VGVAHKRPLFLVAAGEGGRAIRHLDESGVNSLRQEDGVGELRSRRPAAQDESRHSGAICNLATKDIGGVLARAAISCLIKNGKFCSRGSPDSLFKRIASMGRFSSLLRLEELAYDAFVTVSGWTQFSLPTE
jgi:hypothetical protein